LAVVFDDKQLDAAEDAASRAIDLISEKGQEYLVCQLHRVLGKIYQSKGEKEKAIHHFETALGIASPFNWHDELFWIISTWPSCFAMKASSTMQTPTSNKPSHTLDDDAYKLGRAMEMQAECLVSATQA
jgi:tetratricopeptide (TPR) repeat protein